MWLAGDGRCDQARTEAERAVRDAAADPAVQYYAAASSSICGDRNGAVRYAVRAVEGGVEADVRTNPDLRPLLTDPALQKALRK
jgi:hypothetical protein